MPAAEAVAKIAKNNRSATTQALLAAAARTARKNARAFYSRFRVGAAVLDDRGQVHIGCNVENASFGLTVCAERNAVAAALVAGARAIVAVAVVSDARPLATPCGACRQVLVQFAADQTPVWLVPARGSARGAECVELGTLLPRAFRGPPTR